MTSAIINSIKKRTGSFLAVFILAITYLPVPVYAQTDSTGKVAPELLAPSMDLVSAQKADNTIDLKATMRTKFKGNSIKLPFLKITFSVSADGADKELGHVITNKVGVALFNFKADSLPTDKDGKVHLKATFAGNKSMESAEGEVVIRRAKLDMVPVKGDSLNSAQVKLIDLITGKPVADATIGLYVKRSFFPMKIGEAKTDSLGAASIDVPANLPGDSLGNLTLISRVDENELYGTVEFSTTQKWGKPVNVKFQELPRALWSSHPPTWMLITFIVLMTTVWGHYIVIVYELFRLRKEEPHLVTDTANN